MSSRAPLAFNLVLPMLHQHKGSRLALRNFCRPAVTLPRVYAKGGAPEQKGKGFGTPPSERVPRQPPSQRDESDTASSNKDAGASRLSEPFVPRGPTMQQDYIERGMMQPDSTPQDGILPQVVADRMIRRIAAFAGVPLATLFLFFSAYFVARYRYDVRIIPVLVAYTTLGCIGAAGVGITYGIMSSSWDDDDEGSALGWKESKVNLLRARDGLASAINKERREEARTRDMREVNKWREANNKRDDKDK
jgi:hypothetical protein